MLRLSRNTQSDKIAEIGCDPLRDQEGRKDHKGIVDDTGHRSALRALHYSFDKFLLPRTDKSIINPGARTIDPGQRCDRLRIKQRAQGDVVLRYFGKRACGMARLVRRRNSA
jgi:hypothetical protein